MHENFSSSATPKPRTSFQGDPHPEFPKMDTPFRLQHAWAVAPAQSDYNRKTPKKRSLAWVEKLAAALHALQTRCAA
jgi:hypothetical protein